MLYLKQIKEKSAIWLAAGDLAIWCRKPGRCTRHYLLLWCGMALCTTTEKFFNCWNQTDNNYCKPILLALNSLPNCSHSKYIQKKYILKIDAIMSRKENCNLNTIIVAKGSKLWPYYKTVRVNTNWFCLNSNLPASIKRMVQYWRIFLLLPAYKVESSSYIHLFF